MSSSRVATLLLCVQSTAFLLSGDFEDGGTGFAARAGSISARTLAGLQYALDDAHAAGVDLTRPLFNPHLLLPTGMNRTMDGVLVAARSKKLLSALEPLLGENILLVSATIHVENMEKSKELCRDSDHGPIAARVACPHEHTLGSENGRSNACVCPRGRAAKIGCPKDLCTKGCYYFQQVRNLPYQIRQPTSPLPCR